VSARTTAEIAAWIVAAFGRVDLDDALTAVRGERVGERNGHPVYSRGLGSDDMPSLSLQERAYTEAHARMYGEWGCIREVLWEIGKPGEAFYADRTAMRAAEFVAAFVRRNGRVQLTIRDTLLNGGAIREMLVESISDAFDQRAHDRYEQTFPRVASTPRRSRYSVDPGGEAVYDPALPED
jgi:hypothetical protein